MAETQQESPVDKEISSDTEAAQGQGTPRHYKGMIRIRPASNIAAFY